MDDKTSVAVLTATRTPDAEAPPDPAPESIGRIVGLDAARAIAVFGMYYSHVGPYGDGSGFDNWLMDLPHGRSSALFATLAGLSLVLIAGGARRKTGRPGRQAVVKIVIRAVILLALGTALTAMGTSIVVILAFYGLYFLLALPFLRLRARTLAILAGVVAIGGPVLVQYLWTLDTEWLSSIDAHDPLVMWRGDGITSLLLNGTYPAVTWMAYLFAGMAIGKLDLGAKATKAHLAVIGPSLALIGYGGSWLASRFVPAAASDGMDAEWKEKWAAYDEALKGQNYKNWDADQWKAFDAEFPELFGSSSFDGSSSTGATGIDPVSLIGASPHSGTPFELVGNIGVAVSIIVGMVWLLGRFAKLRWWFAPLVAVGSMSLTVYVGHVVAVWFLHDRPAEMVMESGWKLLGCFVLGAVVFALVWKRFLKRGPLEYGMTGATKLAKFVK